MLPLTPLLFVLVTLVVALLAGFLGALLGLGGGIIVIPALTLLLGVDIRLAIGASIVSVIATSTGAAAAYVRDRLANLKIAMFLELGTTTGALTGAWLAGILEPRWLFLLFGCMLAYSGIVMLRKRSVRVTAVAPGSAWEQALDLEGDFEDTHGTVEYRARRPGVGLGLMYVAGVASGLLGIGSGVLKVPAMDLAMGLPIKVSTATSNFMIGVTAAASAALYFSRGQIDPFIAGPVAVGVLGGAMLGTRVLPRINAAAIRRLFVVVLFFVAVQMLWKGLR